MLPEQIDRTPTRGQSGRFVTATESVQVCRDPVPVTCMECGTPTTGEIWRNALPQTYRDIVQCAACGPPMWPASSFMGHDFPASPMRCPWVFYCRWCSRTCHSARRGRIYCSDVCRVRAAIARRPERDSWRRCAECRESYAAPRSDGRYCSARCRQAACRARAAKRRADDETWRQMEAEWITRRDGAA